LVFSKVGPAEGEAREAAEGEKQEARRKAKEKPKSHGNRATTVRKTKTTTNGYEK